MNRARHPACQDGHARAGPRRVDEDIDLPVSSHNTANELAEVQIRHTCGIVAVEALHSITQPWDARRSPEIAGREPPRELLDSHFVSKQGGRGLVRGAFGTPYGASTGVRRARDKPSLSSVDQDAHA